MSLNKIMKLNSDKNILLNNCPKKEQDFNNLASALTGGAIKAG